MSRYLIHFLLAVISIAIAMLSFNWFVDPYAIFRTVSSEKRISNQPVLVISERIFKTVSLARQEADVVFLGTSRTDIGIGRDHQAFVGRRVFNLATFGQPIVESRRLMEIAVEQAKPQTIIVGLDFFAFNGLFPPPSDFVDENFDPLRRYKLAFSISTSVDAWKSLRRKTPGSGDCCYLDGFRTASKPALQAGTIRRNFTSNERMYLMEKYLPYPDCAYSYTSKRNRGESTLDEFRGLIRLAHRHGIDLRFFISPSHARQWETLAAAGLWDKWEEWKRLIAQINSEEAKYAEHEAFPLWDFSGYDTISTEEVPRAGEARLMRWYTDSSHYTPAAGDVMLDRLFGLQVAGREIPDDFGIRMNSVNLDGHLANIRAARQRYRETHAEDIAEIETIAREVEVSKQCPRIP